MIPVLECRYIDVGDDKEISSDYSENIKLGYASIVHTLQDK